MVSQMPYPAIPSRRMMNGTRQKAARAEMTRQTSARALFLNSPAQTDPRPVPSCDLT